MLGELSRSGIGTPLEVAVVPSVDALQASIAVSNRKLLRGLRESDHSNELLRLARKDADVGRLVMLQSVEEFPVESILLHPRFAVVQSRADGSAKIRDVDHFSWGAGDYENSVNGHTAPQEKLSHDTLDGLGEAMSRFVKLVGQPPGLMKADIKSAFRRIPVKQEHRWACGVAFVAEGRVRRVFLGACKFTCPVSHCLVTQVFAASHAACPFGAIASVHAWERRGMRV